MQLDWLWHAIVANWIRELLVLATGVVFAYLRRKNVSWLPVLSVGFFGSVLMSVAIYAFLGRPLLSRQQPETTPENVEQNIKVMGRFTRIQRSNGTRVTGKLFPNITYICVRPNCRNYSTEIERTKRISNFSV